MYDFYNIITGTDDKCMSLSNKMTRIVVYEYKNDPGIYQC